MKTRKRTARVILDDGTEVIVRIPNPEPVAADVLPEGWRLFSATEERVLALFLKHRALVRERLCQLLDESPDGRMKGILATLVGRKVLLVTGEGYQINLPDDRLDELKRLLVEPLETVPAAPPFHVNGTH